MIFGGEFFLERGGTKESSRQGRVAVKKQKKILVEVSREQSKQKRELRHQLSRPPPAADQASLGPCTAPNRRSCQLQTHRFPFFRFRLTFMPLAPSASFRLSRFRGLLLPAFATAADKGFPFPPPSLGRRAAAAAFAPGKYLCFCLHSFGAIVPELRVRGWDWKEKEEEEGQRRKARGSAGRGGTRRGGAQRRETTSTHWFASIEAADPPLLCPSLALALSPASLSLFSHQTRSKKTAPFEVGLN